jgi:hypothetical protein
MLVYVELVSNDKKILTFYSQNVFMGFYQSRHKKQLTIQYIFEFLNNVRNKLVLTNLAKLIAKM